MSELRLVSDQTPTVNLGFSRFWEIYPFRMTRRGKLVKLGKGDAEPLWAAAVKVVGEDVLCAAARAYGEAEDPCFIKDCKRWLKAKDYDGDYGEMVGGQYDNV